MKPKDDAQPQAIATTTKSVPVEQKKPTGPAVQHGGSSGSAEPVGAGTSSTMTPVVARRNAEEPCTTPSKRAKTNMGLEICVLQAMDDVFDPALGGPAPSCQRR